MTVTDEHQTAESLDSFVARVQTWAAGNLTPVGASDSDDVLSRRARERGLDPANPFARGRAALQLICDAGFGGLTFPKEYGGQGLPMQYLRAFNAAVAGYDLSFLGLWVL